jgi:hypothetical protein
MLPLLQLDGPPQTLGGPARSVGGRPFKPQTVLLSTKAVHGCRKMGYGAAGHDTGVVLGEPKVRLGERGRREAFGLDGEKVFSPAYALLA